MNDADQPPIPFPGMLTLDGITVAEYETLVKSLVHRLASGKFTVTGCIWLTDGLEFDIQTTEDHEPRLPD